MFMRIITDLSLLFLNNNPYYSVLASTLKFGESFDTHKPVFQL